MKLSRVLMKLGTSSQDLQNFILIRLDLMKNLGSTDVAGMANPV
jgi:hypothetical protein